MGTQDNAKLLQQLKSDYKRTTNWNKYQSEQKTPGQNQYLNYLIDSSFQAVNRLFELLFANDAVRAGHKRCFLLTVKIKTIMS